MGRKAKRSRRASGTGSIYKDGNHYRVQVLLGYEPVEGKPILKKVRAATHEEAVAALKRLQSEHHQGKLVQSGGVKLSAFIDNWLDNKIKPMRAPKTYAQYKWVLSQHVVPSLGNKRLEQVKRRDVQALVKALSQQTVKPKAKEPKELPTKTLGRRTLQLAVTVLHSLYEDAIRDGLAGSNPCGYIELPQESKKPPQFLTSKQVPELIKALKESPIKELLTFMLATGARVSEACGIRWQDLDLEAGVVRIAGQLQPLDGKLQYRPTTKTNQDRMLPLPASLTSDLKDLKARQLLGEKLDPDGIAFLNAYGRRLHSKEVHTLLKEACVKAKIPIVSPHKLRHTAATLALMETGDLHAVQKILGHQQVSLTSDLYGHATAEGLRPVVNVLGRIIDAEPESTAKETAGSQATPQEQNSVSESGGQS